MSDTLLTVRDLHTHFRTDAGTVRAVDGISFEVQRGEVLGIVGESGAGKSVAARSIMRLIDSPGVIVNGEVRFEDDLLVGVERGDDPDGEPRQDPEMLSSREIRERIRGREIAMIFQDPTESLNPVFTVSEQLSEIIGLNRDVSAAEAEAIAVERLREVGIPEAERRMDDYPHEFSGGMRQRVLIAMAFACEPSLVIADEPTTALDVTVEAQILDLVKDLAARYDTSFVWVTHDMGVVAEICDRVAVMYLGELVELADKDDLFESPKHPYTRALLSSIPVPDPRVSRETVPLSGDVPSPIHPPSGCRFHTRCPSLVAPAELDLSDDEWDRVRRFVRAVQRESPDAAADDARATYFPDDLPAGEAVERALSLAAEGAWRDAASLLTETFVEPSVCTSEVPALESPDELDRIVSCHHYS
ncbi:ABC transporter ATP-binding protein [Haloferax volcanii]|uniref:Nickel import system ATP-binding protein NikD n=3 Tax=Haloferax volcanii TaxID=2246 RepID=D4GPC6_HALVD|nr:ABC transporter ATP-binding protein [Haloferax volcanii]ADE01329.1 ABC-type transport system ATP-binding protein (probable substrate dipeptide/oligopeptide) [Haloferax volcanii DS2]ELY36708.1 peptide ABC transporter ATP-binding protein [Haloferax volcanii DS2]MBS8118206.1 ABC transporter ATP-binding protein [Haloferax volcanii]MBS8123218.1 ABC transporter ATP-binding protein [Haloferax volcanii]MBS8127086.1 ABC transporter ATP-binding protein [Haloferax volcanii]